MDSESSQAGSTRRRASSLVQQIIDEERIGIRRASPRRMPSDIPEVPHSESPTAYDDEDINPVSSGSDWEMDDIRSDEGLEDDEETGLTVQDRQKRTRRKRRNTLADERIVPDSNDISKEEERLASATFMRDAIINCILIGLWYTFSISISVVSRTTRCYLPNQYLRVLSTTNGCSQKATSTSISLSSQPAYTCSYSFSFPRSSYTSSPTYDRNTHRAIMRQLLSPQMEPQLKHHANRS
jgi:hypothetical protein